MGLTATQAASITNKLYDRLRTRRTTVSELIDYAAGRHPLRFASAEFREFHAQRFSGFSDNWCGVVARAAAERTEVFGLRLGDDADVQSADEAALWRDWEAVDGPAKAAQGYLCGTTTSTSYALVWGDSDGNPVLTWETPSQAIVDYDEETGAPRYGLKAWSDDDNEHATLYTADEVWKFSRVKAFASMSGLILPPSLLAGGWSERADSKPVIVNPLGVLPLVEHPNRPQLDTGAISDISGVVAMQDAMNLMWAYLFGAADFASHPARVVMGQEPPKMPVLDANGQKIGEQTVDIETLKQGRLLWLTGQNAKIGQWEAAKLDVFTDVIQVAAKHVSAQSQTPIHLIHGELGNVNGDSIKALDGPLVAKVLAGRKHLTRPTREVFRRLALVRENKGVAEACRTAVVQFKNPETMLDSQVSDAAAKDKAVGWPFAAILERRYNLSQPEIARVLAMADAEAESIFVKPLADVTSDPTA